MASYEFLTPEWVAAASAIRDEYRGKVTPPAVPIRANLVITGAPFDEGRLRAYVDTSDGELTVDVGAEPLERDVGEARQLAREGQVHLAVVRPERVFVLGFAVEGDELDHRLSPLAGAVASAPAVQRCCRAAKLLSSFASGRITCTVAPSPIRSPSSLRALQATWTRLRS